MGDSKSVSSLHKDHYENLYCVIRGTKRFLLFPPTDRPYLPYKYFHSGKFESIENTGNEETFGIANISDSPSTPWIAIDPENPDLDKYPEFSKVFIFLIILN